jgi:acyl-CoA thioester hydrolase
VFPGHASDPDGRSSYTTEIQVRFSDTDALGHLNNASYAAYAETARLDFFARLGVSVNSIILAHLAIEYRRQIMLGDPVSVTTRIRSLGNTSITLEQDVVSRDQIAAEIRSVVVFFNYGAGDKRQVPPDLRARIVSSPDSAVTPTNSDEPDQSDGYR